MPETFRRTQEALLSDSYELREAINDIRKEQEYLHDESLAQTRACLRLLLARQAQLEGAEVGDTDLLVLIRQIARYFGVIRVPSSWWQTISSQYRRFGLEVRTNDERTVGVIAYEWMPAWLPNAYEIDTLVKRRNHMPVLGDGSLYDMMLSAGKPIMTYQSEGQRHSVQSALFAVPGSTTLITLPTGAGKSMGMYLPTWIESEGGKSIGGTTLVIVPTVALAIDQTENARRFFHNGDPLYSPHYIDGDKSRESLEKRATIRKGIKAGTLPLVFMSPESLIGSEFSDIFIEAAKTGNLKRVVVDEAHLIETWGASFRTDFQLLATYCRVLHEVSEHQLSLLLLSATISPAAYRTLQQLFTLPGGNFVHVQVNQLRPEIGYWMAQVSYSRKREYVSEALRHLPRPAILYLTSPEDAEHWFEYLQSEGYRRIATFTGNTGPNERLERIRAWRENRIDLMIATSAFGLGVDKPDVRTIIHATFPENMDRFYQEVGRGGRDGCSSISLLVVTEDDLLYARSTASKARITPEIAWERWVSMFHSGHREGSYWYIDRQAIRRPNMRQSDKNLEWNEHVLLLMQRAGMIRIVQLASDEMRAKLDYNGIFIEILKSDAVNTEHGFKEAFEPARTEELNQVIDGFEQLVRLFNDQTGSSEECVAYAFDTIYAPVGLACGGCPACRRQQRLPYAKATEVDASHPPPSSNKRLPRPGLHDFMGSQRLMQLIYDSQGDLNLSQITALVAALVKMEIPQVILPDEWLFPQQETFIKVLQVHAYHPHLVMSYTELADREPYDLPTAIMLSRQTHQSDRLYQRFHRWQMQTGNHLVYIVPRTLDLPSLNGRFIDRVGGHQETVDRFLSWVKERQYTL